MCASKEKELHPAPQVDLGEMLGLALPMIIIQMSVVVMQFVDAWMVSYLGTEPLAAILPAGLLAFVPLTFGIGLLTGVNTFVSQCLGKGWKSKCSHYAWQGAFWALGYGASLLLLWPLAPWAFRLLGHEPVVQELECIYFQISLLTAVPILITISWENFYIGIHRPAILAWVAIGSTLLNIFFNYLLIFGHGGFPALGLAGAAWGTLGAVLFQMIALGIHFLFGPFSSEFGTRHFFVDRVAMGQVLRVGAPAGAQMLFDLLSWGVALVGFVGCFGTTHLAATTIIVRYMHLSFMPPLGLAHILLAMVGKSIGAHHFKLANAQTYLALKACMVYMGSVALFFFFFRYSLVSIFTNDPEVIAIGAGVMVCVAIFQIFDAMNIIFVYALRGAGDTFLPAIITIVLCLTVFIGGGFFTVSFYPELQSLGPWIVATIYIVLLGLSLWFRWEFGPWHQINIFQRVLHHPRV